MKNQPTDKQLKEALISEIPVQMELLKQKFDENYKICMILIKELEKITHEI